MEIGRYVVFIGIVKGRAPNQTLEWYKHATDFPQGDAKSAVAAFERMLIQRPDDQPIGNK